MTEHPNARKVREAMDHLSAGRIDRVDRVFTAETRWHFSGSGPLSGDFLGAEGLAVFRRQLEIPGLWVTPQEVLANDQRAIVFLRVQGEHLGRRLDIVRAEVMTVHDGKVLEYWGIASDPVAQDRYVAAAI